MTLLRLLPLPIALTLALAAEGCIFTNPACVTDNEVVTVHAKVPMSVADASSTSATCDVVLSPRSQTLSHKDEVTVFCSGPNDFSLTYTAPLPAFATNGRFQQTVDANVSLSHELPLGTQTSPAVQRTYLRAQVPIKVDVVLDVTSFRGTLSSDGRASADFGATLAIEVTSAAASSPANAASSLQAGSVGPIHAAITTSVVQGFYVDSCSR